MGPLSRPNHRQLSYHLARRVSGRRVEPVYDTNFGALIVKRYPFALSGCRKRSHGATSIGSFSYHGRGWKLLRQHRCWSFHHGDAVLHRLLHLLNRTHAYLAHALARDAELVGKLVERDRFFGEPTRLEYAPLPVVE